MPHITPTRHSAHHEDGYILVWVMFLLAVFSLWLSVAVPHTAKEIQRDREVETMHRGKQYIRAVQLYYRRFHAFPPNANALVNTNNIRFLRKKYIDPITGKDDWRPIRFGEAKTQTLGFFGQPIAGTGSAGGTVLAGTGPSGNSGLTGTSLGSSMGTSSIFGSSSSSSTQGSTSTTSTSSTGSDTSSSTSSSTGLTGQTFGGAGIIGFSPASSRQSILVYKKKNHYNEWEFIYDPLTDMKTISGNTGSIGQSAASMSTAIGSSSTNSTSSSSSNSSSSTTQNSSQQ